MKHESLGKSEKIKKTFTITPELFRKSKLFAAEKEVTWGQLIEDSLHEKLARDQETAHE